MEVCFCRQDVLKAEAGNVRYDVIVSNPPYIAEKEKEQMDANVLDWEPSLALFVPDDDPLLFYRKIALLAMDILTEEGAIYFEINQAYGPLPTTRSRRYRLDPFTSSRNRTCASASANI